MQFELKKVSSRSITPRWHDSACRNNRAAHETNYWRCSTIRHLTLPAPDSCFQASGVQYSCMSLWISSACKNAGPFFTLLMLFSSLMLDWLQIPRNIEDTISFPIWERPQTFLGSWDCKKTAQDRAVQWGKNKTKNYCGGIDGDSSRS